MPKFKYVGKNLNNKTISGFIDAENSQIVYTRLRDDGIFPSDIKPVKVKETKSKKLNFAELSAFLFQLSTMLSAGVSMLRSIKIIINQTEKEKIKTVYQSIYDKVFVGDSLSNAMEQNSGAFPNLLVNMIKAGEESGTLEIVTKKMAVYYEKENKTRKKMKSAMTYPIILLVLTITITLFIFIFVLPGIISTFDNMEVPLITKIVIYISNTIVDYWYMIIIYSAIFIATTMLICAQKPVALLIDKKKIGIPKVGRLLSIIYTSRFARTLSSLYSSGVSILEAVEISARVVGNRYIYKQFEEVFAEIRWGNSLSDSLTLVQGLDKKLAAVVGVGEESGKLDDVLNVIADSYDNEAEISIQTLLTYIEPIMIVFIAFIVGTVMISVLMPILNGYQSIG